MIHVADLDLDGEQDPALPPGEVFALVWAGGQAIGHVWLTIDGGEPPGTVRWLARRQLVQPLAARLLTEGRTTSTVAPGDVSVVVCTRNRPVLLEGCLDALAALHPAPREVIVVDNAPDDDRTAMVAERYGVRYVTEPRPGLDRARNLGWRAAEGVVVAYVDDDARPHRGWVGALAAGYRHERIGAVTGLVAPAELATPAQVRFELHEGGMGKGFDRRLFGPDDVASLQAFRLGVGTNMSIRRAVLEGIGGFDDRLDVGTPTRGGGDLDILHRVVAAGWPLAYEPSAVVRHLHRRSQRQLLAQLRDNGVGWFAYLDKRSEEGEQVRDAVRREKRRWYVHHVGRGVAGAVKHRDPQRLVARLAELSGRVRGAGALTAQTPAPPRRST
jgi:glycosyltransferase involved in cell wall biosynthesis